MVQRPRMPTATVATWRLRNAEAWLWVSWEQDHSLFNPETGDTHLLGDLPVAVLGLLQNKPSTLPELSRALARECDVPDNPQWQQRVAEILAGLDKLELLDRTLQ